MQTVTTYYHAFRRKQQSLFSVWILYPVCRQCLACSLHFVGTCSLHSWQDSWAGERRFAREWEFNPTFQQSSHGFTTKTKALLHEIPPTTQAMVHVYYRLYCLALINQAGGLYGRIWTKVLSTDQMQWGLYTRPRSRFSYTDRLSLVNKIFLQGFQ